MMSLRGSLRALLLGAVLVAALSVSRAAHAQLSNTDKQTLAELALRWAVDGGIPDVGLMKDPAQVFVEDHNLPPRPQLHVPQRTVTVASRIHLQAEADLHGDFLYFHFGPITGEQSRASVPITLVWAVGIGSKAVYLSGGGTTLQFELRHDKWTLLPVTERWTS